MIVDWTIFTTVLLALLASNCIGGLLRARVAEILLERALERTDRLLREIADHSHSMHRTVDDVGGELLSILRNADLTISQIGIDTNQLLEVHARNIESQLNASVSALEELALRGR